MSLLLDVTIRTRLISFRSLYIFSTFVTTTNKQTQIVSILMNADPIQYYKLEHSYSIALTEILL